jgi:PhnB protein
MKLSFHLSFNGRCEEAFRFYENKLGGKVLGMLTYGNSPMAGQVSEQWRGKIVHATMTVGDAVLAGADVSPEKYQQPRGFSVLLSVDNPADAELMFDVLAENGAVGMPLQKTFWSPAFGVLVDQFGIPWEISCLASPG